MNHGGTIMDNWPQESALLKNGFHFNRIIENRFTTHSKYAAVFILTNRYVITIPSLFVVGSNGVLVIFKSEMFFGYVEEFLGL